MARPGSSGRVPDRRIGCRLIPLWRIAVGLLAAAWLAVLPAASPANKTQESVYQDDAVIGADPGTRAAYLAELKALGVDTIHFLIAWRDIAPNSGSTRKPSGFGGSSPDDYPASSWQKYDDYVRAAKAAGFDLLATPNGPAPRWAQSGRAKGSGLASYKPKGKLFGNFVEALGARYSGNFDPGGGDLPRIDRWSFWNEANQGGWLQPQTVGSMPVAPKLYRSLHRAGVSGLKRSGHGGDQIYLGELAPVGSSEKGPTRPLTPGEFLRELFCLDALNKPFRGAAARARGCNGFKKLNATGFAHHPYMKNFAALSVPKNRNWMPIAATKRLTSLLNRAAAKGRIPGNLPIYFTEFGVQSNPPDKISGVSLSKQAAYINDAEYLAYLNGRTRSWAQYEMRDDALFTQYGSSDPRRYGGFQTGLRFADGSAKPSYDAYRLPIHVKRLSAGNVRVWGMVRPIDDGPRAVQIEANGVETGAPVAIGNSRGYFETTIQRSGAASARWSFTWTDNGGKTYSSRQARATRK